MRLGWNKSLQQGTFMAKGTHESLMLCAELNNVELTLYNMHGHMLELNTQTCVGKYGVKHIYRLLL